MITRRGRMTSSLRRALLVLPLWIASVVWMLNWWLTTGTIRYMFLFVPLTLALLYEFAVLPSVFLYFVMKAKKPARRIAQKGKRVAVISLCVPSSESMDIVENQLRAMSLITYPHDSWILDEGNDKTIKKLAKQYGVKYFTRRGVKKYNKPMPPFQQKTKAGNVNAWLDHVKDDDYDYFVQLDIDHIPKPNYLHKTLGYFRDAKVAWVQAPSVYGNLTTWAARGAAERELVLQGPLQMGFYGHSDTPFIIGSHCTYRMAAIREIGGFQPTRAEDHLDTIYLAHYGYKGVFLPEVIAVGDGPETLNTYLAQQFAWAYSMFQVLLMHTPRLLKTMPNKRKWQFLFAQTWYPLWSLSYLIMFIAPIIAMAINRNVSNVKPGDMLIHFVPLYICGFLVWLSARPIMQPRSLHLSWRGILLHAITWPIILRAILAALFKVKKPYMITPKGSYAKSAPVLATYRPFLYLGVLSAGSVIVTSLLRGGEVPLGQSVFCITNAAFMLAVCAIDIFLRARLARPTLPEFRNLWLKPVLATTLLALTMGAASFVFSFSATRQQALAMAPVAVEQQPVSAVKKADYSMTTDELIRQIKLVPANQNPVPTLGMYNPTTDLPDATAPYIEHSFTDWRDDHYFAYIVASTAQHGNTPLVTIEPRGEADGAALLQGIAAGAYDDRLSKLATIIKASKNPVYIRFAHEMELTELYAWGNQDPQTYIAAYHHMADLLRANGATNTRFVWSPAGNPGAEAYYPGDDYADIIGTTVLYDEYWSGSYLPEFSELVAQRQWLQTFGKPVWIVEFGAGRATKANQMQLIQQAVSQHQELGFSALIYLNLADANVVGPDYRLDALTDFGPLFLL